MFLNSVVGDIMARAKRRLRSIGASTIEYSEPADASKRMVRSSRRDAIEKFAPLIQAQRYLEFYDDLLHRRSARRGRVRAAYKNEAPCINIDRAASFDRIFNSVASEAILPAYSNLVREHEESEIDRYLRGEQIATLTKMLKESEADRAARLEVIEAKANNCKPARRIARHGLRLLKPKQTTWADCCPVGSGNR